MYRRKELKVEATPDEVLTASDTENLAPLANGWHHLPMVGTIWSTPDRRMATEWE